MLLSDKLGFGSQAIDPKNILPELDRMLDSATVYVSWTGSRLVSIEGYEESVEIDQVVLTFFRAEPLSCNMPTPSQPIERVATVQERAFCFAVANKIEKLYKKSDAFLTAVTDASYFWKVWHCLCCIPPMIAQHRDMRSVLNTRTSEIVCRFTPEDFQKMFPQQRPDSTHLEMDYEDSFGNGRSYSVWRATAEMICQVALKASPQ